MKKIFLAVAALAAMTACQKAPKVDTLNEFYAQQLSEAKTFADTVIATDGSFIGGVFGGQVDRLGIENVDRNEILRGMRAAFALDSANQSYIAGFQMGVQIRNIYYQLNESEPISKEKFISTIAAAFRLDSLKPEEIQGMEAMFNQTFEDVKAQAQKRKDEAAYKTPEAQENRYMADAVAEKLQSNPDYKVVGEKGIMKRVITAGSDSLVDPNVPVVITLIEKHADSEQQIRALNDTPMLPRRSNHPVLANLIPYLSVGETAEFFVPYAEAYGVQGNESIGVGPCEAILCVVTVKPFNPSARN